MIQQEDLRFSAPLLSESMLSKAQPMRFVCLHQLRIWLQPAESALPLIRLGGCDLFYCLPALTAGRNSQANFRLRKAILIYGSFPKTGVKLTLPEPKCSLLTALAAARRPVPLAILSATGIVKALVNPAAHFLLMVFACWGRHLRVRPRLAPAGRAVTGTHLTIRTR